MVALYVDGEKVGTLADAERLVPWWTGGKHTVELRDEATGQKLGTLTPEPLVPWEPDVTEEELDRRAAEPGGLTIQEFWKKMGVE